MRTTVTLDEDLVAALRRRAHERGLPFKQVLNDAIRTGLHESPPRKPYRMTTPRSLGLIPGIDYTKTSQLADELENEELVRKLQQGR